MGLLAQRLHQELPVDLLDLRVLVGLAQRESPVLPIDRLRPLLADLGIGWHGLSASADAATRAAHDLDEVVVRLPGLNLLHQCLGLSLIHISEPTRLGMIS